jgi:CBS domain-containing protein
MAQLIHSVLPTPPRKIVYIAPEDTVKHCIDLMVKHDIGALVVVDNKKQLIGLVSERDIVRACVYEEFDLETAKAKDIAYTAVTILSPHDAIEKAMQVITDTKRRHVLIREHDQFIAILSIGDLLYHLLEDEARTIAHLEHYIRM